MKIGILTFHRAINYGAVLQAYALQQTLCSLGHEVFVIDYRQPRVEGTDRRPFQKDDKQRLLLGGHLRSWWYYDKAKSKTLERRNRFDDFLQRYLNLSTPCNRENIPHFETYVIGSDQVWNSAVCDGLDPVFWGDFSNPSESKIISYAASTSVKDLTAQNQTEIQRLLNSFSYVTVRELETCDYLNLHFKLRDKAQTVLDPTLLADKSVWNTFENDKFRHQDYVLYFGARFCPHYPNVLEEKAKSLASQYGCGVKKIDFNEDTPVDFVNKFRYAKAVVTSSFHGTAFSLIFNRPLCAVMYGDEQDARYVNVLRSVGAEKMLVKAEQDVRPTEFDYSSIDNQLDTIRKKSIKILQAL
jgi:hypothetical protein